MLIRYANGVSKACKGEEASSANGWDGSAAHRRRLLLGVERRSAPPLLDEVGIRRADRRRGALWPVWRLKSNCAPKLETTLGCSPGSGSIASPFRPRHRRQGGGQVWRTTAEGSGVAPPSRSQEARAGNPRAIADLLATAVARIECSPGKDRCSKARWTSHGLRRTGVGQCLGFFDRIGSDRTNLATAVFAQTTGGAEGNRTPDLCSAIAALSHLSYGPAMGAGI
jgi:hypothetical protein